MAKIRSRDGRSDGACRPGAGNRRLPEHAGGHLVVRPGSGAAADALAGGQRLRQLRRLSHRRANLLHVLRHCHNARSLRNAPSQTTRNVAAHMRGRANLTGEEYAKLIGLAATLARRAAAPRGDRTVAEAILLSQPISELQPQGPADGGIASPPRPEQIPPPRLAVPPPLPGSAGGPLDLWQEDRVSIVFLQGIA